MKRTPSVLAAAGALLLGALSAPTAVWAAEERALAGARLATMRALAAYLDETAQGALEGASDAVLHGATDARFVSSIRSFAKSAHAFRRTIEDHGATPFEEVSPRVADLTEDARLVDDRIRSAEALAGIYDEWDAVLDVLQKMTLLLAGRDVEVPAAYVVPPLTGPKLDQFRQLAHDLDVSAARAHHAAGRALGEYRDRGEQFLGELAYFAALSRDLHERADAGDVNPKDIGAIVDHLLREAREADRRMRDAGVFPQVWDDSGRTILILGRMAGLVRS